MDLGALETYWVGLIMRYADLDLTRTLGSQRVRRLERDPVNSPVLAARSLSAYQHTLPLDNGIGTLLPAPFHEHPSR